jgi:hypothetical protein
VTSRLADKFLPAFDVSDAVAVQVAAPPSMVWASLMDADLLEVGRRAPLSGALAALRMLPEIVASLLHGERPPRAPERMRLRDLTELPPTSGGWVLLEERPGEAIVLGLVGKFWRPVIEYADVPAERFMEFAEPGYAKTVYDLSVRSLEGGDTLLSGLMRTTTTDEHARRWFRRYWTFGVGSGAHVVVQALLESVREDAEARPASPGTRGP